MSETKTTSIIIPHDMRTRLDELGKTKSRKLGYLIREAVEQWPEYDCFCNHHRGRLVGRDRLCSSLSCKGVFPRAAQ